MGLFIQYSFKWYPYWYILMYILMYIPLVHSFWLLYSLLFKYTPGYYPLVRWWTFSWFSLSCNSKQSCSSRHFTVYIQRSLSATYLGVELLDMFIFNLNLVLSYCRQSDGCDVELRCRFQKYSGFFLPFCFLCIWSSPVPSIYSIF